MRGVCYTHSHYLPGALIGRSVYWQQCTSVATDLQILSGQISGFKDLNQNGSQKPEVVQMCVLRPLLASIALGARQLLTTEKACVTNRL